jgi:DNA-binding PadR family transcriptional regulator
MSSGAKVSYELNATAGSLLGFLHDGPLTGWDLVETAQLVIGDFWSLTRSQVYRELSRMAQAGLVEAHERGPRDRRPYELTDAGRDAFRSWVQRPPAEETIRFPLLLTVAFGRHVEPEVLQSALAGHRAIHTERLVGYRELAGAVDDPFSAATLDFGIRYEEAVLAWFAALPPPLDTPGASDA